jgi:hypothetical protein
VALCQARISTKPLWGFSSSNPYHSQSRAEHPPYLSTSVKHEELLSNTHTGNCTERYGEIMGKNCYLHRWRWHRGQFATGINNTHGTGGKFYTGVVDAGGKFATGVFDTDDVPSLANISANFMEKFEMILMLFSGAWGRWFMKKTWSKKSCDTVALIHLTMIQVKVMLCVQWTNADWGSVYFELKQNDALCTMCLCSSYTVKLSKLVMLNKWTVKLCVECVNVECCTLCQRRVMSTQCETRHTMIQCKYLGKFVKNNTKFWKFSKFFSCKNGTAKSHSFDRLNLYLFHIIRWLRWLCWIKW